MNRPDDDDLRGLFDEERRADQEKAPPFLRVLDRGAARRFARLRWTGRAFAMAATAVTAMVVVLAAMSLRRSREIPPNRIETWKPPTDFLLESAHANVFDTIPLLPEPVPDYSPLLAKEKGSKS